MRLTLTLPDAPHPDKWPNGISCHEWFNGKWLARNWPPNIVEQMQKVGKVVVTKDYAEYWERQKTAPKEGPKDDAATASGPVQDKGKPYMKTGDDDPDKDKQEIPKLSKREMRKAKREKELADAAGATVQDAADAGDLGIDRDAKQRDDSLS